jgi:TPR repeat protein
VALGSSTGNATDGKAVEEEGDARVQFNLGVKYATGEGVPKNPAEAVKWYRKAADQGYAPAQSNLGVMYAKGEGVAKDTTEAAKWYRKAADKGYARAQYNLAVAYGNGQGVARDYGEAYKWANLAAAGGISQAINIRNNIERFMTTDQIAKAQQATSQWAAAHEMNAK